MRPGFSVHKVVLLNALQVFVLLQVLTHLHMFWVGLEIGVSRRCCLVRLLQLKRETEREGKRDIKVIKIIIILTDFSTVS